MCLADYEYPSVFQRIDARKGKNKPDRAGDISIFINGVIEIDCEMCGSQYSHTIAQNTVDHNIKCFICNRYSHKSCYENVEIKQGFYFICSVCTKKSTTNPKVESDLIFEFVGEENKSEEKKSKSEEKDEDGTTDADSEKQNAETLCPLLVVGEYPHGAIR